MALPILVNVAGLALAAHAGAEAPPERVELRYQASEACPVAAAFGSEVAARIHRPIIWSSEAAERVIAVELVQSPEHARGSVQMLEPGPVTRREFVASSCAEVSAALSLVVALALDPNARTELVPVTATEPPPVLAAPLAATAAAPVATPPPSPAPAPVAATTKAPPPASRAGRPRFFVGPAARIAAGYAPVALVSVGAALGVRSASESWLSPSFGLSPLWGETGRTGPDAGASFALAVARLQGCPFRFRLARALSLLPCAIGELGRLTAAGSEAEVDVPTEAGRFWSSLGLSVGLQAQAGAWFGRLELEASAPLTRDRFVYFDPNRTVHRASVVVGGALLTAGVEL